VFDLDQAFHLTDVHRSHFVSHLAIRPEVGAHPVERSVRQDGVYDGDWARAIELCGRSAEIRRDLGNLWGAALCLCNVALAQRQAGLLQDASRSVHQALEDSLAVDARMVVLPCFEMGALLATDLERPQEAAILLGASAQLREELDTADDDFEHDLLDRAGRDTSALLGDEDFAQAFEHGRSLLIKDAAPLAIALTTDE
jgi:hypothetical protein